MTNDPDVAPNRTRNRTDEPALWRLICHWMVGGTFQTRYVWRQNTQERNLPCANLKKRIKDFGQSYRHSAYWLTLFLSNNAVHHVFT